MSTNPYITRTASKDAEHQLFQAASALRRVAQTGAKPKSQEGRAATALLLQAAIAWRQSAIDNVTKQGGELRPRPPFDRPPRVATKNSPPKPPTYNYRIQYWASKYAWDKQDGLPAGDAATKLVHTAIIGTRKTKRTRPDQQQKEQPEDQDPTLLDKTQDIQPTT